MSAKKKTEEGTKESTTGSLSKNEKMFNTLFQEAKDGRQTSCCWMAGSGSDDDTNSDSSSVNSSTGGNWDEQWNLQDKFAIMYWGTVNQSDGYRSNIKSPEIAGRIQSTMHKLAKVNLEFVARPKSKKVRSFKVKVIELLLNNVFQNGKFKHVLRDSFYDALKHGTVPISVEFESRKRKVKMPITKAAQMTEEEKKALKETQQIPYREVEIIDKRDVILNRKRIQDVYWDPSARNLHGDKFYASYQFDVERIPLKRFNKIYNNKPGYKNVGKVKGIGSFTNDDVQNTDSFFEPPTGLSEDYVFVVKMQHYDDDLFMVRANDQFIYESPLQYADKKIDTVVLVPCKFPDYIYGIGLVDMLIPIVDAIEALMNAINDYVVYTTNPVLVVDKGIYSDFSKYYREAVPGLMIPASNPYQSVMPLKMPSLSMDVFQVIEQLRKDAVLASQQDPSQLGVVVKNATATANIINKEVMDAYVNYVLDNFTEGLEEIATMVLSRLYQFLTEDDVYEIIGEDGNVKTITEERTVPVYGKKIDIDWDEETLSVEDAPDEVSYLSINEELFQYIEKDGEDDTAVVFKPEDLSVHLTAESKEITSKAMERQAAAEDLAQLSGYMVDPRDKKKVAAHPLPLINAPKAMEAYFEKRGLDKSILLNPVEEDEAEINRAMEQNAMMFDGKAAAPIAGESERHIQVHVDLLRTLTMRFEILKEKAMAPTMTGIPVMVDPRLRDGLSQLSSTMDLLRSHLEIDSLPAWQDPEVSMAKSAEVATPPAAGNLGGGTMFGGAGAPMGGNAPMPNMPAQAGFQGGPGAIGGI